MSKDDKDPSDTVPLQEQMNRLSEVVEKLENPEVSLEDSLALYEQGMALVASASKTLDAAEQRVAVISADGDIQAVDS